jgi:hypothetical protein
MLRKTCPIQRLVLCGEEFLACCMTLNHAHHPLSAIFSCLFSIFAATLIYLEAFSSCHHLRICHAMVIPALY